MSNFWDAVLFQFSFGGKPLIITPWTLFGFLGNILFTTRVLIQWIASEKAKKSVAPPLFWWTSLFANLILLFYSWRQVKLFEVGAITFVFLYTINIIPYIRNIVLSYKLKSRQINFITFFISSIIGLISIFLITKIETEFKFSLWFLLGTIGGFVFGTRFIWQWIYSEWKKESILPLWFWWLSICSSLLNLIYAFYLRDFNFILGFIFNTIPMIRNVMLIKKSKHI